MKPRYQEQVARLRKQGVEHEAIRERLGLSRGQYAGLVNRLNKKEKEKT